LSEAYAETAIVPATVAPAVGEEMLTAGGVVSGGGPFDTVIVTGAEVLRFPATSRATAVSVYEPLGTVVVSATTEYGALVSSAPRLMPLYLN
jgi:phage-related minor tail protein